MAQSMMPLDSLPGGDDQYAHMMYRRVKILESLLEKKNALLEILAIKHGNFITFLFSLLKPFKKSIKKGYTHEGNVQLNHIPYHPTLTSSQPTVQNKMKVPEPVQPAVIPKPASHAEGHGYEMSSVRFLVH